MDEDLGDIDLNKHHAMLEKILSSNKAQNLKKPTRSEPALKVSEFDLVKSITGEKGSVQIEQLTKPLKDLKSRIKIKEKVKKSGKIAKTLPKPLEKPQAERIRRVVAYEKTRLELDRWEAIVTSNRASTDLHFPLENDHKVSVKEALNFPSMWRLKSKLEQDLEKVDGKVEEYHVENTDSKEGSQYTPSLKEMLLKRKEAAKLRAYQSYREAKARRQNKIKSKKYHRIQKREKIKKKLKEFELLQKTDPEEALKKLEEIEKARVEERFSLRHKSTGKWARNQQVLAKYDKESRKVLANQLALSRELTQKTQLVDSDEDEEELPNANEAPVIDKDNPWTNGTKPDKEVTDFVSGYKKYWAEKNTKDASAQNEIVEAEKIDGVEKLGLGSSVSESNREIKNKEQPEKQIAPQIIAGSGLPGSENIPHASGEKKTKKRTKEKTNVKKDAPINGTEKPEKQTSTQQRIVKQTRPENSNSGSTSEWEVIVVDPNLVARTMEARTTVEKIFNKLEKRHDKKLRRIAGKAQKLTTKKSSPPDSAARETNKPQSEKIDLSMPIRTNKPILDEPLIEVAQGQSITEEAGPRTTTASALEDLVKAVSSATQKNKNLSTNNVDPGLIKASTVTQLHTAVPDFVQMDDDNEAAEDFAKLAAEGFEDEDLVGEFTKEKKDEIEKNRPKDVNLALPGWGSWGGAMIKMSKRKQRRFIVKAPPQMPRRDDNKGTLIINEDAQKSVKEHMVSEVPFPFKSMAAFEASLRAPIGNTFLPETAFRRLIKPAVTTKMGAIIEPMSKDVLLSKRKD